jgi:hypothetical protein
MFVFTTKVESGGVSPSATLFSIDLMIRVAALMECND